MENTVYLKQIGFLQIVTLYAFNIEKAKKITVYKGDIEFSDPSDDEDIIFDIKWLKGLGAQEITRKEFHDFYIEQVKALNEVANTI